MRWFLVGGGIGLAVAAALTFLLQRDDVSLLAMALWPTSILGLVDPTTRKDQIITATFTFGGNFMLYGVVGLALVRWFVPDATKIQFER